MPTPSRRPRMSRMRPRMIMVRRCSPGWALTSPHEGNLSPGSRRSRGMQNVRRLLSLVFLFACVLVADAWAAGAPVPSAVTGRTGVVAPGGGARYFAVRSGSSTVVRAVSRSSGRVLRTRTIAGRWTIPAVTVFGGATGLSADGRTLVLARPSRKYPPASSPLAVLDARTLRVRREIALPGFSTVDAVSPDGHCAYVIQYKDANR